MAATTYDALSDVLILGQITVDDDIGIRYGAEANGLLVSEMKYDPTREIVEKTNHRGAHVITIGKKPMLKLSVTAEVLQRSGRMAMRHPLQPIHKSYVLDAYAEVAHGFDLTASSGYFYMGDVSTTSPQADMDKQTFSLTWFRAPTNTVNHVAAPTV